MFERDIEKYAKDYLQDKFEYKMSYYRKQMLLKFLNKYNAKNIVDIGPAYNYLYEDYKNFDSYIVIEPSKIMCDKMKKCKNVIIYNDYLENVCNKIKDADFIIASGLIHEIPNPNKFLNCIKQMCSRNTVVHISAPNSNSFHLVFAYEAGLINKLGDLTEYSQKMQRCATYNKETLTKLIYTNGFKSIENGAFFIKLFNQTKMEKAIETEILDDNLLNALNAMIKYIPDFGAEIYINAKVS